MMYKIALVGKQFIEFVAKGFQTLISVLRIFLLSRPVSVLPKRVHKNCSILGNGPSLNASVQSDIKFIKQTDMVCVNTFADSDYYEVLKPTNYVLIDPLFFSEKGRSVEIIVNTYVAIVEKTNWELDLFVPRTNKNAAPLQELLAKKSNIKVVYFNYTIFEGFDFMKHLAFSKGMAMPQSQNVMVASLFLMINRKYETIFLFGADHSWHEQIVLNEDNKAVYRDLHFFDKKELKYIVIDEIHKGRVKVTMRQQFISLSKAFYGYEVLARYARYKNVNVLNASKKSYIDAFEKVNVSLK